MLFTVSKNITQIYIIKISGIANVSYYYNNVIIYEIRSL